MGCIRTAVHRRRRGGYLPLDPLPFPPPLLPFQCLRLTAKTLLRHLRRHELKNFWPAFGGDHRGTIRLQNLVQNCPGISIIINIQNAKGFASSGSFNCSMMAGNSRAWNDYQLALL